MSQAADTNDGWKMWFLTESCNILPPPCNWGFHFLLLSAAHSLLFCLRWFKVSNAWPPALFAVTTDSWRMRCVVLVTQAPLFAVVSHRHVGSVCRCFSRRFSSTFLRRPQAPMTTNGWSYKPSLEYAQVCVSVHFLKENCPFWHWLLMCDC